MGDVIVDINNSVKVWIDVTNFSKTRMKAYDSYVPSTDHEHAKATAKDILSAVATEISDQLEQRFSAESWTQV